MKKTLALFAIILFTIPTYGQVDSNESESGNSSTVPAERTQEDAAIKIGRLEKLVERNETKIQNLYFREEELIGYGGTTKTSTVKVKNRIYQAGQKLIAEQQNEASKTSEVKIQQLEEILEIQERMLFLVRQEKTRKLEKSLKKLDDPKEIKPVFFGDF